MCKRAIYQCIILFFLASSGVFLLFPQPRCFAQKSAPGASKGLIQIKAENGLLSVKLENAPLSQVLQEIARQTGVQFIGWENAEGTVTQQFENVPLDEGLKKISQSFIMILKKSGEEGKPLRVDKVIIIAQKTPASSSSPEAKTSEATPHGAATPSGATTPEAKPAEQAKSINLSPQPSSTPGIGIQPTNPPSQDQVTLPSQKAEEPPKENTQVSKIEPEKKEQLSQSDVSPVVQEESSKPAAVRQEEAAAPKAEHKKGKGKKKSSTVNTASLQSSPSLDRTRGEEAFKQKRWDKAIKYLGKYLEQNPSDQEVQEKVETAKQNAAQAISLYQQGRKSESEKNYESAYEYYKKSCDIYPVVYDAYERMIDVQRKMKK